MPDPRSRRGRWHSLAAVLLVCACAVVAGARSIDELAERGARASGELLRVLGVRRHPLRRRRNGLWRALWVWAADPIRAPHACRDGV
ncbi:transposase family protein [Streptomyces sp. NPDC055400]